VPRVSCDAKLAALPKNTFSLWNRHNLSPSFGIGLGVVNRAKMFATTENILTPASNVTLDSYTRVDAAAFYRFNDGLRAQANIENLFGEDYYLFANSNSSVAGVTPPALLFAFESVDANARIRSPTAHSAYACSRSSEARGPSISRIDCSSISASSGVCSSSAARRATGLKPPDCLRHNSA